MKSSSGLVLPGGMNIASYLLSMVFKIYRPKIPEADIPLGRKPCLSNLLPHGTVAVHLLSMVFKGCWPESPGVGVSVRERPCLEHVLEAGCRHT